MWAPREAGNALPRAGRREFRNLRRGEDRGPDRNGNDRRRYYFDLEQLDANAETAPGVDTQDLFDEGREREIRTNRAERKREAVEAAKRLHGLSCQVCEFNGDAYGDHGAGFIEVHHLLPVAEAAKRGKRSVNARTELAVLCSNCHRMIHRGSRLLTLEELREIRKRTPARTG
jgi:predicted HNH restriction endonuclease